MYKSNCASIWYVWHIGVLTVEQSIQGHLGPLVYDTVTLFKAPEKESFENILERGKCAGP